jgi:Flp pilus assembly protein TadD
MRGRAAARVSIARAVLAAVAASALLGCTAFEASRAFRDGTAALDRGETALAVDTLERAAVLEPRSSAVQNHLGIAYEAADDLAAAERAYERAVALDCENRAAEQNLAALRARLAAQGRP